MGRHSARKENEPWKNQKTMVVGIKGKIWTRDFKRKIGIACCTIQNGE